MSIPSTNDPIKNPRRPVDFLTRPEAAQYLRISVRLLDQKAANGEIVYYKLGQGPTSRVLYKFEDLKQYIEKCRVDLRS